MVEDCITHKPQSRQVYLDANKGYVSIIEDENYLLDPQDALPNAPFSPN